MELIQRLTSPMMLMTMAGALTASVANAQFVQTQDSPGIKIHEHLDSDGTHTSKWVQKVSDDEHVYVLELVNGVFSAEVDGKDVPASWIHDRGNKVVIINDGGETVYEFIAPKEKNTSVSSAQNSIAWAFGNDDDHVRQVTLDIEQPKVMLGINMSEPGAALRKHLKLTDDRQVIMVEKVVEGLPAEQAGMESYDIIISIDGSDEASGEVLHKALMSHEAGDTLKLVVLRAGDKLVLTPKLVAYDGEKLGTKSITISMDDSADVPQDFWFSDDGNSRVRINRIPGANSFPDALQSQKEKMVLHEEMMKRAKEALAQAERQVLELRDGQLFVHRENAEELQEKLLGKLRYLENNREFIMEEKLDMENRLAQLEDRFAMIEDQMEKVSGLIERMFEKMTEDRDED
ncbi:MAG: PDZ domain-containing protein [Phycisphaerales bacterium]|nr:PDZ domain-containing protein [Phycisphaerales bacterium]